VTGDGMEQLRSALVDKASSIEQRDSGGRFRLVIDRVFSLQGHGTVVAGTVLSGSVQSGDGVELLPSGSTYRVREIRVNEGRTQGAGRAGDRVALNLVGLEKEEAWRGSTLATPGWLESVSGIDAECSMLPGTRLEQRQRVRFHTGTAEVMAWAIPMATGGLEAGCSGFVHFHLEEPVVALPGDRFVIRRYSPVSTIGGGVILEAGTVRLRARARDERLRRAEMLSGGDLCGILEEKLAGSGESGFGVQEVSKELGREESEISAAVAGLVQAGKAVVFREGSLERAVSASSVEKAIGKLTLSIQAYHSERQLSAGLLSSQVARILPNLPQWFTKGVLLRMSDQGMIRRSGERIALSTHPEALPDPLPADASAAISSMEAAGLAGWEPGAGGNSSMLESLVERGLAVELEKGLLTAPSVISKAVSVLKGSFGKAEFRLGELRQAFGVPRKTAVLWAELLDRAGATGRKGDLRYLLEGD